MTDTDRDILRGWQAARKGEPLEPYRSQAFRDGYQDWLRLQLRKGVAARVSEIAKNAGARLS